MKVFSGLEHEDIGARLRLLRQTRRLTQSEMAQICAMSVSNYSKLEIGVRHITSSLLSMLTNQFGVPADWILRGEGQGPVLSGPFAAANGRTNGVEGGSEMASRSVARDPAEVRELDYGTVGRSGKVTVDAALTALATQFDVDEADLRRTLLKYLLKASEKREPA